MIITGSSKRRIAFSCTAAGNCRAMLYQHPNYNRIMFVMYVSIISLIGCLRCYSCQVAAFKQSFVVQRTRRRILVVRGGSSLFDDDVNDDSNNINATIVNNNNSNDDDDDDDDDSVYNNRIDDNDNGDDDTSDNELSEMIGSGSDTEEVEKEEEELLESQSIYEALREKADQLKEYIRLFANNSKKHLNSTKTSIDSDSISTDNEESGETLRRRILLDSEALAKVYKKLLNVINVYDNNATLTNSMNITSSKRLKKMKKKWDKLKGNEKSVIRQEEYDLVAYSDLNIPNRKIWIVTTASLPWMTGTSVNPLLRAAYLYRRTRRMQFEHVRNETANEEYQQEKYWDDDSIGQCGEKLTDTMVTLVVPWLELKEDRVALFGEHFAFDTEAEQEKYIREWLRDEAKLPDAAVGLKILFYPARYHSSLGSIFAMGDIGTLIPDEESDICVLEEPEHLNWYRAPGDSWTKKFNYVVGIAHTNYKEYASGTYSGLWTAPAIGVLSSAMVRAYCHKVIKLSNVLQTFAPEKEATSNVHGVRSEFLREGERRGAAAQLWKKYSEEGDERGNKVYFIGKLLWAKGLDRLIDLEIFYKQCTRTFFDVDIFGDGPQSDEIKRGFLGRKSLLRKLEQTIQPTDASIPNEIDTTSEDNEELSLSQGLQNARLSMAKLTENLKSYTENYEIDIPKSRYELRKHPIPATFHGRVDHATLTEKYKIFVNPSVSEVLCTTTAEALAMGKFVIIPVHPSNEFFMQFPNCLAYRSKLEFAANLRWALDREPEPMTQESVFELTWEAATERFIQQAKISQDEAEKRSIAGMSKLDERIAWFHHQMGKGKTGDTIRKVLGGGPVSDQAKYIALKNEATINDKDGESSSDEDESMLLNTKPLTYSLFPGSSVSS